jgi:hypothetical protein
MEKRKVGRPRKTSTVTTKKDKVATNWKAKYEFISKELEIAKAVMLEINDNAQDVVQKQADNQLDIVKLVLDSYSNIEHHCTEVSKLTGHIEESDILYLTSVARRALLHKFVEFNESQED